MKSKLELIKNASNTAPHKRQTKAPALATVKRIRDNQSFYVGDTAEIITRLKKGTLSKAVQKALHSAYASGELAEFLEDA